MELKDKIKYYREKKKISKNKLAQEIDVSPSYITRLENGDKKNPSLEIKVKLAKALNIQVTDLDPNIPIWEEFDAMRYTDKLVKEMKEIEESNKIKKEILENGDLDDNKIKWILEDQENLLKKCDKIVKGMEDFTNIMILFNSKEKDIISELIKIYNSAVFEKSYDVNKLNDEQYNKLKQNIRNSIKESFKEFENK
ncbi:MULTISPECIES: helix-turn-helix domain-containing protein [Clostridium]|uniref:helix-turn-helix domain-containing protein n=1 Tax=Clostridium TaxID=1485 RepID=UPI001898DB79|nr:MULTISPECIES: helix-turn-helix transcriptional regulator [Clostridium]MDB2123843.1 helix-turn-helix transcriptional regulator [Clostridium paraputrificum]MDU6875396.1 helix-turn-helix transcriptional regulator [Clostridium sp.]MDU6936484.1 helix-turn-helix transcriptional regulator [Clostridium sp.]